MPLVDVVTQPYGLMVADRKQCRVGSRKRVCGTSRYLGLGSMARRVQIFLCTIEESGLNGRSTPVFWDLIPELRVSGPAGELQPLRLSLDATPRLLSGTADSLGQYLVRRQEDSCKARCSPSKKREPLSNNKQLALLRTLSKNPQKLYNKRTTSPWSSWRLCAQWGPRQCQVAVLPLRPMPGLMDKVCRSKQFLQAVCNLVGPDTILLRN